MKLYFNLSTKFSYTLTSNLDRSAVLKKISRNIKTSSALPLDITGTNIHFFKGNLYHTGFDLTKQTYNILNSTRKLTIKGSIKQGSTSSIIEYTISRGYRFLLQLIVVLMLVIGVFKTNGFLSGSIVTIIAFIFFLIINYYDHCSIIECHKQLELIIQKQPVSESESFE